jgi:hypothetical protein
MCPIQFQSHPVFLDLLMAYSKAKLEAVAIKHFLVLDLLNRKIIRQCLPMRILLYISFKHIFFSLTCFMGTPNSMRILYNTSLITES